MYEDQEHFMLPINKIIENFEDVTNVPPDYQELMPDCDIHVCETLPTLKIQIASGLDSSDLMKFELIKLQEHLVLRAQNNKKKALKSASQAFTVIQNQVMIGLYMKDEQLDDKELLIITEKLDEATRDIKILKDAYADINNNLKYLYNNFQYLITNAVLNEKNKNVKLAEFFNKFCEEFKIILKKLREKQFDYGYLSKLKDEIIKFSVNRYQLLVAYIVNTRKIVDVNLEILF
jgi:hypothetical protein